MDQFLLDLASHHLTALVQPGPSPIGLDPLHHVDRAPHPIYFNVPFSELVFVIDHYNAYSIYFAQLYDKDIRGEIVALLKPHVLGGD